MNQELRLYTFVNFYLSSIQQGIQSAHVTHSLFVKYPSVDRSVHLWDWAVNDKTMIVLNGGAGPDIAAAYEAIAHLNIMYQDAPLPFECFHEDDSLNGMMTSFGIVVPQCYFDAQHMSKIKGTIALTHPIDTDSYIFENLDGALTIYLPNSAEHHFIGILKACGLAR